MQMRGRMMLQVFLLLVAPSALVASEREEENPVRKVVTLLEDMQAQVQKDADADKTAYDKYACWCETNKGEKTEAITKAQERIADLEAVIEESVATAAQMKTEIAEHKKSAEEDRDSLAVAEATREEEAKAFASEAEDLNECITGLSKALEVLAKVQLLQKHSHGSSSPRVRVLLLQAGEVLNGIHHRMARFHGVMQKDLWDMMGVLKTGNAGAGSAFLGHHDMLAQQPEEKTDTEAGMESNPNELSGAAAGAKSYNARSGQIYGVLETMLSDFKSSLAEAEKLEAAQVKSFEELKAAKLAEIKLAEEQAAAKEAREADAIAREAQAKEDIETTKASLSADEQFLMTLEKDCATAEEEYNKRSTNRSDELAALAEAIKILSEDDARDLFSKTTLSFLQSIQIQNKGENVKSISAEETVTAQNQLANKAMQRLLRAANKHKDWLLASLAVRVRLDAFTKVKELMDKMVVELKAQQKAEVEKKDFCNKEIDTTEDQLKVSTNEKEDLEAKKAKLEGEFETYTATLASLKEELAGMEASVKKMGEDRKAENAIFQQAVADQRATIHILKKAEARLQEFYSTGALAQVKTSGHQEPAPPMGTSYEKNSSGGTVLQMLASIIKDASVAEKELVADEQDAQEKYANMVKEMNASMDATKKAIVENSKSKDETAGAQAETDGALLQKSDEISNLDKELSSVHSGCDFIIKYFDVRQTARREEMEAIAEAKAILSGADFATALEKGDDAVASSASA